MKTPKDPRHQARRLAISYIYSSTNNDVSQTSSSYALNSKEILKIRTTYDKNLYSKITLGVTDNLKKLKALIKNNSKGWDLPAMHKVDLAILLCAVWEIKNTKTPPKVVIDEAVELAKEFGEKDSARFVNGILAGILN